MILEEEFLFFHNNHLDEDVLLFSRIEMDRDLGSFKRARSAGEGSWTAGGWTRQRVLGGVIVDARHHHRHHNHHHPRRLVQTQRRVISRRGGERKTAKWRSREAPVCRKECRRAPRLLSSLQTAGCCAFRKKHAATARPPVLWRNPRSKKKERGEKNDSVPGKNAAVYRSLTLLLLLLLALLAFTVHNLDWVLFGRVNFEDWIFRTPFLFFFFFEKSIVGCSGECFSRMDTEMECFNSREFFVVIIVADLKMKYFSGLLFLANGYE